MHFYRQANMAYYTDLFSPETYEAFSKTDRDVTGFRLRQQLAVSRVQVGDKLICYLTKLGRWMGILEVASEWYRDDSPRFVAADDPFVLRFKVKPIVWLDLERAIPIRDDQVWSRLSFTRGHDKNSSSWTGILRSSLRPLDDGDGRFLEQLLTAQHAGGQVYPVDQKEYEKLLTHKVRGAEKLVSVSVPQDTPAEAEAPEASATEARESIRIQALLARVGAAMGFKIWLPRGDRARVLAEWKGDHQPALEILPLNYDETTLKTIEQIDVLWLKGRSIARAFEVEHTTSIYSGILRMADLLALQPNMDIRLHIVAPYARRDKVFQELRRPVFSLLDKGPLYESCTFLSYDSIRDLARLPHLAHLSDSVLDDYVEEAE
jgi:hypothetical protein